MKDRLTELISQVQYMGGLEGKLADHLLSEGVIVPPYKPLPLVDEGDRVLCPECETDLMGCYYSGYDNSPTVVTCYGCGAWIDATKAVDKEEAERALAERREG